MGRAQTGSKKNSRIAKTAFLKVAKAFGLTELRKMHPHDLEDWMAVFEADEIRNRIDFQSDMKYARDSIFRDGSEVSRLNSHRDELLREYDKYLCLDHDEQPPEVVRAAWNNLKTIGKA